MAQNNPPAFPKNTTTLPNGNIDWGDDGMTLRDWFAGQALAMLTRPDNQHHNPKVGWQRTLAWAAYSMADAMLEERKEN